MQRFHPFVRLSLLATSLASCMACAVGSAAAPPPSGIRAVSWIAADGNSRQTLTESNPNAERQPASLTKLMTAYIALDALKRGIIHWEDRVPVNASDVAQVRNDEAKMYLVAGQSVTVRNLVRGLIVASANDAALVLTDRIGGSVARFEQLMNENALQLGMTRTHFSTPSGVTTPGNYSTARDRPHWHCELPVISPSTTPTRQSGTLHTAAFISGTRTGYLQRTHPWMA